MRRLFQGCTYLKIGRDKELFSFNLMLHFNLHENRLFAQVTGKRKREVGIDVPAKFTSFTTELHIARILERELNGRAVKYNQFELKKIAFDEKKFPMSCCFKVALIDQHLKRVTVYS